MILGVLILWILIKLQAPAWCYILLGGFALLQVLDVIMQAITKRLEKLNDEMERRKILEKFGGR